MSYSEDLSAGEKKSRAEIHRIHCIKKKKWDGFLTYPKMKMLI